MTLDDAASNPDSRHSDQNESQGFRSKITRLKTKDFFAVQVRCIMRFMNHGYAVSTDCQSVDAQVRPFTEASLLNTLAAIVDRKIGFRALGDVCATPRSRMAAVLGGLAEFERELIWARTAQGRRRAVTRGVKSDRRPKLTPHQMKEAIKRPDAGEPVREIAHSYNTNHSTISRLAADAA